MKNEKALKSLIKELNHIEIALLIERVLLVMDLTLDDIKQNPEQWERHFIHPSLFEQLSEKVKKHLDFNKQ
jgi:hypothetical protein